MWFLDGVTALNQMRAAHALGIDTFSLWRLGSEDRALWAVWDRPFEAAAPQSLSAVPPGQDVDDEGTGEIIRIQSAPAGGDRTIKVDPETNLVSDEIFQTLPKPYVVDMYGGTQEKKVAFTFDDGPDPDVDAEDPRRAEAVRGEGDLLPDRRPRSRNFSGVAQAGL